ncbi:hypothetical protein BC831DRAFT_298315 [Entophlyctis helioformis]|nr:hypothetical protein BC831DRAFT_298315 [Entophlyctis helioformis]
MPYLPIQWVSLTSSIACISLFLYYAYFLAGRMLPLLQKRDERIYTVLILVCNAIALLGQVGFLCLNHILNPVPAAAWLALVNWCALLKTGLFVMIQLSGVYYYVGIANQGSLALFVALEVAVVLVHVALAVPMYCQYIVWTNVDDAIWAAQWFHITGPSWFVFVAVYDISQGLYLMWRLKFELTGFAIFANQRVSAKIIERVRRESRSFLSLILLIIVSDSIGIFGQFSSIYRVFGDGPTKVAVGRAMSELGGVGHGVHMVAATWLFILLSRLAAIYASAKTVVDSLDMSQELSRISRASGKSLVLPSNLVAASAPAGAVKRSVFGSIGGSRHIGATLSAMAASPASPAAVASPASASRDRMHDQLPHQPYSNPALHLAISSKKTPPSYAPPVRRGSLDGSPAPIDINRRRRDSSNLRDIAAPTSSPIDFYPAQGRRSSLTARPSPIDPPVPAPYAALYPSDDHAQQPQPQQAAWTRSRQNSVASSSRGHYPNQIVMHAVPVTAAGLGSAAPAMLPLAGIDGNTQGLGIPRSSSSGSGGPASGVRRSSSSGSGGPGAGVRRSSSAGSGGSAGGRGSPLVDMALSVHMKALDPVLATPQNSYVHDTDEARD